MVGIGKGLNHFLVFVLERRIRPMASLRFEWLWNPVEQGPPVFFVNAKAIPPGTMPMIWIFSGDPRSVPVRIAVAGSPDRNVRYFSDSRMLRLAGSLSYPRGYQVMKGEKGKRMRREILADVHQPAQQVGWIGGRECLNHFCRP